MLTVAAAYGISFAIAVLADLNKLTLTDLVVCIVALLGYFVYRAGARTAAITGVILAVWLEIHTAIAIDGMNAPNLLALTPFLAGTSLLLGGRAAIMTAAGTSLSVAITSVLAASMRGATLSAEEWYTLAIVTLVMFAMAVILLLGLRSFAAVAQDAQESERKLADLFLNAPDGIVALDSRGLIEAINPAAARLLDIEPPDATGQSLTNVLAPRLHRMPRLVLEQLAAGEITTGSISITRADGRPVSADITARRVTRDDGARGTQIMLRDVSQRRAAEERATQLGRVIEDALNEVYLFNADSWTAVSANKSARANLGYTLAEFRTRTAVDINPAFTRERRRELDAQMERGAVLSFRGVHRRKDGSAYPVDVQIQLARFEDKPVIIVWALDVTDRVSAEQEQKRLQTQLQHAQKMEALGQLAGGVAHDFNNLLQVIGSSAELLGMTDDDRTKQLSEQIAKAQQRGARLTKQLLAFARRDLSHAREISLSEIVSEMHPLLQRLVGDRIRIQLSIRDVGGILADPSQVEQVLLNLVANARDAMPDGGSIYIGVVQDHSVEEAHQASGDVLLTVKDTGHGIRTEYRNKIFDPFFTTKPRGKGTGLGLATVHGIVKQNGGQISVTSHPEQGTCFTIQWPGAVLVDRAAPADVVVAQQKSRSARILLAEDDEQTRALVRMLLESSRYVVTEAADGESALAHAEATKEPFDLLLTDVIMPGISGIDLADKMRRQDPQISILFMSGYLDDLSVGTDILDQEHNVVFKPFEGAEIRNRIERVLASRSADTASAVARPVHAPTTAPVP